MKSIRHYLYNRIRLLNLYPLIYTSLARTFKLPLKYQIELTTKCNLRCPMCSHNYMSNISKEMKLEQFEQIYNNIGKHLPKPINKLLLFNLTGIGEVLLDRDFLEIIRFLKKKGAIVTFADNFTIMTKDIARELIDANVDNIFISFDAAEKETYEKMRVGAKFEKVLENISNFVELKKEMNKKLPNLIMRFVPTSENIHELPKVVKLAKNLGMTNIDIPPLYSFEETKFLEVSDDKYNKYKEEAVKLSKELGIKLDFSSPFSNRVRQPINKCKTALNSVYINVDGFVLPCCFVTQRGDYDKVVKTFNLGNIFEKDMKQIWNSEKYKQFRKTMKNNKAPGLCKGCPLFYSID